VEDRLGRASGKTRDPLIDEVLHTLGDLRLGEEGRPVPFDLDQLVELLDLVAELDRERVRLELAGVADRFD
jgi:hypothetical protein